MPWLALIHCRRRRCRGLEKRRCRALETRRYRGQERQPLIRPLALSLLPADVFEVTEDFFAIEGLSNASVKEEARACQEVEYIILRDFSVHHH